MKGIGIILTLKFLSISVKVDLILNIFNNGTKQIMYKLFVFFDKESQVQNVS